MQWGAKHRGTANENVYALEAPEKNTLAEGKDPGSVFNFGTQETLFQIKEQGTGQMVTGGEDALRLTSLTKRQRDPAEEGVLQRTDTG